MICPSCRGSGTAGRWPASPGVNVGPKCSACKGKGTVERKR